MFMSKGPYTTWYDKVSGKSVNWKEKDWKKAGYRHVPNGVVRKGSFIGKKCGPYAMLCKSWRLCR